MPMCKCGTRLILRKRIFLRELSEANKDLDATFNYENQTCLVTLASQDESIFVISSRIPHDYKGIPSQIKFVTPCRHPYLNEQNELNLEYFAEIWRKFEGISWGARLVQTLREVLLSVEKSQI